MMPRPVPTFRKFVGQKKQVDLLRRQLEGAKLRGEPFPPTAFIGPSGVGKTLLAESLAAEYGSRMIESNGHESILDHVERLKSVNTGDFYFIDESHAMSPSIQELFYGVIDRQRVPNLSDKSSNVSDREQFVEINHCSVILATDQPGKLLNALEKRAELRIRLSYYSIREMREIVDRLAADYQLLISAQASGLIAKASHGIPRRAKHHLLNLRRHFPSVGSSQHSISQVREFFNAFGIDEEGLRKEERDYLCLLGKLDGASLESLALGLGLDKDYLRRQVEPILTRAGLIAIGARGRQLTDSGQDWIKTTRQK